MSPCDLSQPSKCCIARQFEGSVTSTRTTRPRAARRQRLDVLEIGADVADVREGEADDLTGVGGIGHDLLIAGHAGVEADPRHLHAGGADAAAQNTLPSPSTKAAVLPGAGGGGRASAERRRSWGIFPSRRWGGLAAKTPPAHWAGVRDTSLALT